MEKKFQIFISSTYEDLKSARKKVQDAILSMYHFPVGMELFGAADEEQWEIIQETIDSSDYYILIIGYRYGSIIPYGPDAGISYTEKEFRYAKEKGIPILVFIMNDDVLVKQNQIEHDQEKIEKLKVFKESVKNGRTVDWWSTEDELASKVTASLYKAFGRKKRPGWIRGDSIDIEKSLQEIVTLNNRIRDLEEENRILKIHSVERKPEIVVGINCEGMWRVKTKHIERPEYVLSEYLPLSLDDVKGLGEIKVTQEEIEQYNNNLPSKETLEEYVDSLMLYKYKKEASVDFEFYIENNGKCKANDVNITMEFPDGLLVLERELVECLQEPDAPEKPYNPIEEAIKKISMKGVLEYIEPSRDWRDWNSLLPIHTLKPTSMYYHEEIEGNMIKIEIRDLLHTRCVMYDEYCVVPLKKGNFQIKCTIMCEEYLNPVEQIIDIEVL